MIVYLVRTLYPTNFSSRVAVCMNHQTVDLHYGKSPWNLCAPKTWTKSSEYVDSDGKHAIVYLVEEVEVLQ